MSAHQHGPQCRHGHQHGTHGHGHGHGHQHGTHGHGHGHGHQHGTHGHGHGHGPGAHGHGHQSKNSITPKQYFQKLSQMKQKNKQFYWMELLSGNAFNKFCEQKGLNFVQSINCQFLAMIVLQAQMIMTFSWLPLWSKGFISGLFFPLVFLLFFNLNVVYGVTRLEYTYVHLFSYLAILFYVLTALRSAGGIDLSQAAQKTRQAIKQREYLQNPMLSCQKCKSLKIFRSFHCPICQVCITKFTRHSLAFGSCIGSTNQLLALLFFFSLTIAELLTIRAFFNETNYGLITDIMFYLVNVYIFWINLVQTCTIFILNFNYGITEQELRNWMIYQYLLKIPERVFANGVNKGLIYNLAQSLYALFGISGYESQKKVIPENLMQQQIPISGILQFQKIEDGKIYLINWRKAFFYLLPQLPSHPSRDKVIEMMNRDEPKMIQTFKLQKQMREEVLKQMSGQEMNQFQIQQRVAIKFQQYMMQNSPSLIMSQNAQPPNQQQQKQIQTQMMTHMISQLQQKQPQAAQKLKILLNKLKNNQLNSMQTGMAIRQIQQQIIKKQMEAVMKQRQQIEAKNQAQKQNWPRKSEDQEQSLRKQQISDEDL